jgi:hypothetical protein
MSLIPRFYADQGPPAHFTERLAEIQERQDRGYALRQEDLDVFAAAFEEMYTPECTEARAIKRLLRRLASLRREKRNHPV